MIIKRGASMLSGCYAEGIYAPSLGGRAIANVNGATARNSRWLQIGASVLVLTFEDLFTAIFLTLIYDKTHRLFTRQPCSESEETNGQFSLDFNTRLSHSLFKIGHCYFTTPFRAYCMTGTPRLVQFHCYTQRSNLPVC